jgi:dolichol-phosphate mannosyltransferase
MKICIVIPTYNERENLSKLVPKIEYVLFNSHLEGYIVIVDDNSPDGTGELAEQLAKEYGNIMVLHRQGKLGIGSAYREAFQTILNSLNVDVVLEMDADLSHDPAYIPSLVKTINDGYDLVIGSRYVKGGDISNWSIVRRIISKGANFLAKNLTGVKINDMTSGFRAYSIKALRSIDLESIESNGYAFQVEILYKCVKAGFKAVECPIVFRERDEGKSKLGIRAILEFLKTVLKIFIDRFNILINLR